MSLPVARMSDTGIGNDVCHDDTQVGVTGTIIQGAGNVAAKGLPVARMTDIVMRDDGHFGIIIEGSGTVIANGLPVTRMLDHFEGCFSGYIINGAADVVAGG